MYLYEFRLAIHRNQHSGTELNSSMNGLNCIQGKLAQIKDSFARSVFIHQCTKLDVNFHSGCISPHVLLYKTPDLCAFVQCQ